MQPVTLVVSGEVRDRAGSRNLIDAVRDEGEATIRLPPRDIVAHRAEAPVDGSVGQKIAVADSARGGPAVVTADRARVPLGVETQPEVPAVPVGVAAEDVDRAGSSRRHVERARFGSNRERGSRHRHRSGRGSGGDRGELVRQFRRVAEGVFPAGVHSVSERGALDGNGVVVTVRTPIVHDALDQFEVHLELPAGRGVVGRDLRRLRHLRGRLGAAEGAAGDVPRIPRRHRLLPGPRRRPAELEGDAVADDLRLQCVPVHVGERRHSLAGVHRDRGGAVHEQRPDPGRVRQRHHHLRVHRRHRRLRIRPAVRTEHLPGAFAVPIRSRRRQAHHERRRRGVAHPGHGVAPGARHRRLRSPGRRPHPEVHLHLRFRGYPVHRLSGDLRSGCVEPLPGRRHPDLVRQRIRHRVPTPLDVIRAGARHRRARRRQDQRRDRRLHARPRGRPAPGALPVALARPNPRVAGLLRGHGEPVPGGGHRRRLYRSPVALRQAQLDLVAGGALHRLPGELQEVRAGRGDLQSSRDPHRVRGRRRGRCRRGRGRSRRGRVVSAAGQRETGGQYQRERERERERAERASGALRCSPWCRSPRKRQRRPPPSGLRSGTAGETTAEFYRRPRIGPSPRAREHRNRRLGQRRSRSGGGS